MPGGIIHDVNAPEFTVTNVTVQKAYYCEVTSPCGKSTTQSGFVIVPQPSVAFVTPVPNQTLVAADTFKLRWSYFCLDAVKIEFTLDGGATWTVAESRYTAADREYKWKVPPTETNNGEFRLTDADAPARTIVSAIFRIKKRPLPTYSSSEINFGLVQIGTTASKTITVENKGLTDLIVTQAVIVGSTDVTLKTPAAFTVLVNERYDMICDFTPTRTGPLGGMLTLAHNALRPADTLNLVGDAFVVVSAARPAAPTLLALHANHPNPVLVGSNAMTTLSFDLPKASQARLTVSNLLGKELAVVADGYREAGASSFSFDASRLPAGTYIVRLSTGRDVRTRVMQVLR